MKKILMLDNYDSFTFNLVQLLEQISGVVVDVFRNDKIDVASASQYEKIILSPGPGLPEEAGIMPALVKALAPSKDILGVCLGHQCIAEIFGAELFNLPIPKHGKVSPLSVIDSNEPLFRDLPPNVEVGRYHSWAVRKETLPADLIVTAEADDGVIMALRHRELRVRGVQFHPESVLTPMGKSMICNWVGS